MNGQKLKGILGLAVRAGQACFGEDTCRRMISSGAGSVLLLDGEASENTRKKYRELCERTGTEMILLPPGMIPEATGRSNMAMALAKGAFAEQVLKLMEAQAPNE